ncbi:hypothetical protein PWM43_13940 [Acetobacteraceae bacterium LMG 32668]|uniref:Uncharacterized protein n=1 Tax=Brytella acorum TaxID=2959299 RepID=A0AA35Y5K0_9PROT|nr:hypothetical protein [Brytella acorum]MDF3626033.1 hypothetical protein [Brytella acorum]CAI9122139.1 hypothetical protein LMG32879_002996 [Brytella acorum]
MRDIPAINDEILALIVSAIDNDMDMGMRGIEMVHCHPVQTCAEIGFHPRHQVAGEVRQILHPVGIFRRDDEAELMPVLRSTFEEGFRIGTVGLRAIQDTTLAVAGGAVTLDVTQVGSGSSSLPGLTHHTRLHGHTPGTG